MIKRPLRTIVVGFGQIASGLKKDKKMSTHFEYATHAQVLRAHPGFDWLGVVDPSSVAQDAARNIWNIPNVADNLNNVVAIVDPEVIVVTSPPLSRLSILESCPNLKAVLVEKPLNLNDREGYTFVDTCFKRDLNLQVNFWRRGDDLFQKFSAGKLHELIGVPAATFATYGNGLRNNGSHTIDFIRMLLGEVTTVQANAPRVLLEKSPLPGDIQLPFSMTLETGAIVSIQPVDFNNYREIGLDIWGSLGRLTILQEGLRINHYPILENRALEHEFEINSDNGTQINSTVSTALYNLYENLYAATISKTTLVSSGASALRTEDIINTILSSANDGCKLKAL